MLLEPFLSRVEGLKQSPPVHESIRPKDRTAVVVSGEGGKQIKEPFGN
ncbi:hypothetical protein [uncultured Nitrospira sp.]